MTQGQIWKDFFTKSILPAAIALFLFSVFKRVFVKNAETEYFYVWICCGIPFGMHRMSTWLTLRGSDLGGSIAVFALNFVIGGVIGGVILIWRLLRAAWYVPLTIYRLITVQKDSKSFEK